MKRYRPRTGKNPILALLFFVVAIQLPECSSAQVVQSQSNGTQLTQIQHRFKPDELVVRLNTEVSFTEANTLLRSLGARSVKSLGSPRKNNKEGLSAWYKIKVPPGQKAKGAIEQFAVHPSIENVDFNYLVEPLLVPNDPNFPSQWSLRNTGIADRTEDADIDADDAWDVSTGSSGVVVAIIDTGIDKNHTDLAANIWVNSDEIPGNGIDDDANNYIDDVNGYDFLRIDNVPNDEVGHGTQVAGIAAAVGNNAIGISGVSWSARLMPLKFMASQGEGDSAGAIEALNYAVANGADIVNASFVIYSNDTNFQSAIAAANAAGVLVVAGAGNNGTNNDNYPVYPAAYNEANIIAVAMSDWYDTLYSLSNYGATSVDLAAPGTLIYTTQAGGNYTTVTGTSMSAPHVSGAAAVLLADDPTLTPAGLKSLLLAYADPNPALAGKVLSGGRLNLNNSLNCNPNQMDVVTESPVEGFSLKVAEPTALRVQVLVCGQPVTNATVSVSFNNGESALNLYDAGTTGDTGIADGIYGNFWLPTITGPVTATVSISHATLGSQNVVRSGKVNVRVSYQHQSTAFSWIDTSSGTVVTPPADGSMSIPLFAFGFELYGRTYSTLYISDNGYITFDTPVPGAYNTGMPDPGLPNALIAPFWDDLDSSQGVVTAKLTGTAPNRVYTITWSNVPIDGGSNGATFQASLYEGPDEIVFRYLDTDVGDTAANSGASATVGVEDYDGLDATPYSIGQPRVPNGTAIKFNPVATTSQIQYQVTIDTAILKGRAGSLVMSMVDGDGDNNNQFSILEFSTDGTITANPTLIGDASGTLVPGPAHLGDAQFANRIEQLMITESEISFRLSVTTNGTFAPFPDAYAAYLLNYNGVPYPTEDPFGTDALFGIDINATQPFPEVYAAPYVTTSVVTIGAPTAVATGPSSGAVGQSLTFNGSGSSDPESSPLIYYWDFGDTGTSNSVSPSHAFAAAGTYNVELQVHDGALFSTPANLLVSITGNQPPTANAGSDQTVNEASTVNLNGTLSADDGSVVSYAWTQLSGATVALSNPSSATPSFTAPPATQLAVLKFSLMVTDNNGATDSDTVNIIVNNILQPPIANAGSDQVVLEGTNVTLNGGASSDPDGSIATYAWSQTAGPATGLSNPSAVTSSFTAPNVTGNTVLTYRLTVTDNTGITAVDTVNVTVQNTNIPPVANAGTDFSANERSLVNLSGAGSYDGDSGTIVSYSWTQLSGPSVVLSNSSTVSPSFTAPDVNANSVVSFQLNVVDNQGATGADTIAVTINDLGVFPVANAGADQTVFEGSTVFLNGSASAAGSGSIMGYQWQLIPSVYTNHSINNSTSAIANFVAPSVGSTGTNTYRLTVTNGSGLSATDTVTVTISDIGSDGDNDGVPDGWEVYYFGSASAYSGSDDVEPDGLSNLQEYQQGVNPAVADPVPNVIDKIFVVPGDKKNIVIWDVEPGTGRSDIYYSTSPLVTQQTGTKISDVTSPFEHTGLTNGVDYFYIATGSNNAGESADSIRAVGVPAARSWGSAETVTSSPSGYFVDAVANDHGDVFVVWEENDGSRDNIWARRYSVSAGWQAPEQIEFSDQSAGVPKIASDDNGNAIAVWTQYDGTRFNVWANYYSIEVSSWGSPQLIENLDNNNYTQASVTPQSLRIAMSSNGYAMAVWAQDEARFYSGGSGSAYDIGHANTFRPKQGWGNSGFEFDISGVGDSTQFDVSVSAEGAGLVVWRRDVDLNDIASGGKDYGIWSRAYSFEVGVGWDPTMRIDGTAGITTISPTEPSIASDAAGDAIVTWKQTDGYIKWMSRSYDVALESWDSAVTQINLGTGSADVQSPIISANTDGHALALWHRQSNNWTNTYEFGLGWAASPTKTFSGLNENPSGLLLDRHQNAVATWRATTGGNDMIFATYDNSSGNWSGLTYSNLGGNSNYRKLEGDTFGTAFYVYDAAGSIKVMRYGAPLPGPNEAPTANAGNDQIVTIGQTVMLTGAVSDPGGSIAGFTWKQVSGSPVTLINSGTLTPSFVAPSVSVHTVLSFELRATDNRGADAVDTISVTINLSPVEVNGGIPDATFVEENTVNYSVASYFTDVNGDALTFTATGLPPSLSISPAGTISGTLAVGDNANSPYSVTVTANDGHGGTFQQTFVLTVDASGGSC